MPPLYADWHTVLLTTGTSTHCRIVGELPPAESVPHPLVKHVWPINDSKEDLGKQAGLMLTPKFRLDANFKMIKSLLVVGLS